MKETLSQVRSVDGNSFFVHVHDEAFEARITITREEATTIYPEMYIDLAVYLIGLRIFKKMIFDNTWKPKITIHPKIGKQ